MEGLNIQYIPARDSGGGGGSGTVTSVTADPPLTATPDPITGVGVISHDASGVSPGTYGDTTHFPIITVDETGHVTDAALQDVDPIDFPTIVSADRYAGFWFFGNIFGEGATFPPSAASQAGSSAGNVALTGATLFNSLHKFGRVSTNAASAGAGVVFTYEMVKGAVAGLGGFHCTAILAPDTGSNTSCRMWVGLTTASSVTTFNTEPSATINCIFFGFDSTDSNVQLMCNDSSGTCTKVDLGSSFPARPGKAVYRVDFSADGGGSGFSWSIVRMDTGDSASGTATSDIPSDTTVLYFRSHLGTGPNATPGTVTMYQSRGVVSSAY